MRQRRCRCAVRGSLDQIQSRAEISLHCVCSEHGVVGKDIHSQLSLGTSIKDEPAFASELNHDQSWHAHENSCLQLIMMLHVLVKASRPHHEQVITFLIPGLQRVSHVTLSFPRGAEKLQSPELVERCLGQ